MRQIFQSYWAGPPKNMHFEPVEWAPGRWKLVLRGIAQGLQSRGMNSTTSEVSGPEWKYIPQPLVPLLLLKSPRWTRRRVGRICTNLPCRVLLLLVKPYEPRSCCISVFFPPCWRCSCGDRREKWLSGWRCLRAQPMAPRSVHPREVRFALHSLVHLLDDFCWRLDVFSFLFLLDWCGSNPCFPVSFSLCMVEFAPVMIVVVRYSNSISNREVAGSGWDKLPKEAIIVAAGK